MKKIIIALFITFLLLLVAKFYLSSKDVVPISQKSKGEAHLAPVATPNTPSGKNLKTSLAGKVIEQPDSNFEIYDQMEKKWLGIASNILGSKNYSQYLEMRDRNDQEKMRAYKEYHDYLRLKYGDKYSYHISDDQSIREKKINEHYLNELLKLVGEDKFKSYLKARDDFNEQNRRQSKEAMMIEF
jgi:hypothetical protein